MTAQATEGTTRLVHPVEAEIDQVIALSELAEWVVNARKFVFAIEADINDVPALAMEVQQYAMIENQLAWGSEIDGLGVLLSDINRRMRSIRRTVAVEPRRKSKGAR